MTLRICVVVPCYNNSDTITDVIKDIVIHTPYDVLVVDDGSRTPVADVLYSWDVKKAIEAGRVRIERSNRRQGLGASLGVAIRSLVGRGFTHMVTIGGGGEYRAVSVERLVKEAKTHPWDVIVGRRRMRTSFLQRWIKLWLQLQLGLSLQDPACGLRLYPLFILQNLPSFKGGVDFNLAVLARLLWRGYKIREVETPVPLSDLSRPGVCSAIGIYSILVGVSLVRGRTSPIRLSLAVGVGIAVGCLPFPMWHLPLVVVLALSLSLNILALSLSALIPASFVSPLIVVSAIYIGGPILGIQLGSGPVPHLNQWLAGSLVVGVALGFLMAIPAYFLARRVQRAGGILPLRLWRALSEYYKIVLPKVRFWRRQALIARHIANIRDLKSGRVASGKFKVFGIENLQAFAGSNVNIFCVSAHLGIWEAALTYFKFGDFNLPNLHLSLVDRPDQESAELVPFFGHLAPFDAAIFQEAAARKRPLVFLFGFKSADGTYEIHLSRAATNGLEEFVCDLEGFVRRFPGQWRNNIPFWSQIPSRGQSCLENKLVKPIPIGLDHGLGQVDLV